MDTLEKPVLEAKSEGGEVSERWQYGKFELLENELQENPWALFTQWLEEAQAAGIQEPTAMTLATADLEAHPNCRVVLIRGWDESAITFFTNYRSAKALEIDQNASVCGCIWWSELERQIRLWGRANRASPEEADAYFVTRPRDSRIASIISPQSQIIDSRDELLEKLIQLRESEDEFLARPEHWGGYKFVPDRFEFWQGRPARLHDRIVYEKTGNAWKTSRLAP